MRLCLIRSAQGRWGLCQPRCAEDTIVRTAVEPGNMYLGLDAQVPGMLEVASGL